MVQSGTNITLEDCEDTLHQVVGKAQQLFAYPVSDKTVPNKLKVLFATLAISVTAHMKLVKIFDESVEALCGQRALLSAKYGTFSEPGDSQHCGLFVVGATSEEINVIYDTGSSNLKVSNSDCYGWFSSHNFYHESKSGTYKSQRKHIQDQVRIWYSVRFLLQEHYEHWRYVNHRLHFCRGV